MDHPVSFLFPCTTQNVTQLKVVFGVIMKCHFNIRSDLLSRGCHASTRSRRYCNYHIDCLLLVTQ